MRAYGTTDGRTRVTTKDRRTERRTNSKSCPSVGSIRRANTRTHCITCLCLFITFELMFGHQYTLTQRFTAFASLLCILCLCYCHATTTSTASLQEEMDCWKHRMLDVLMHSAYLNSHKPNKSQTSDFDVLVKSWTAVQEMFCDHADWKQTSSITGEIPMGRIMVVRKKGIFCPTYVCLRSRLN